MTLTQKILIFLGIVFYLFVFPHGTHGDAYVRYVGLLQFLEHGTFHDGKYSLIGPFFAIPLYYLGDFVKSNHWWISRFNAFLFCCLLFFLYNGLKKYLNLKILGDFLLLLIVASMFPKHMTDFYGEVFSAVLAALACLAFVNNKIWLGISLFAFSAANTPATIGGVIFVCLAMSMEKKQWRPMLAVVFTAGLFFLENALRHGSIFHTGYEGEMGAKTILPYSGGPGFNYPIFFGLISILFSFGKGLLFFAPGLLLFYPLYEELFAPLKSILRLWILYLIGLVLVYAKWWAWYGGWFWGPRYFLLASIPAAFCLALLIRRNYASILVNIFILSALTLSVWVGVNGVSFDMNNLEACSVNNAALELLCMYTPEFSVLWRPFLAETSLNGKQIAFLIYFFIVWSYLAWPLIRNLFFLLEQKLIHLKTEYLPTNKWRF